MAKLATFSIENNTFCNFLPKKLLFQCFISKNPHTYPSFSLFPRQFSQGSETASWKGWRDEHVGVYDKQALVLVHYGGGKGSDIVELAYRIQDSVEEKFRIKISPEVNFV